jgi:hypothetical protein
MAATKEIVGREDELVAISGFFADPSLSALVVPQRSG